jgi:predicted amidohydrolase
MTFDLVLAGGRVVDPSQSIDRIADVALKFTQRPWKLQPETEMASSARGRSLDAR